jgi:hypothetical protein
MLSWGQILQTESLIPATGDIMKVVRVPNHANGRLVCIVDRSDTGDTNDEVYWNDAGGSGAWTKGSYGTAEANLDVEHRTTAGTYDNFRLYDIFFVSATEGYAVGSNYIILRTYDAGTTWFDMNVYDSVGTTTLMYSLYYETHTGDFVLGETVSGGTSLATATVVSWDPEDEELIVTGITGGPFTDGETLTGGTSAATTTIDTAYDYLTWLHDTDDLDCVWATETTAGVQTIYFGADYGNAFEGVWRLVSTATAGVGRTYTWNFPTATQDGTTFDAETVNSLFFFDALTGVAGTDNGIYVTSDGIAWAAMTGSGTDSFYNFAYSNSDLASTGYLYSVNYSEDPGRVAVTFTAPSTWVIAPAGWVTHGDTTKVDLWYVDESNSIFLYEGKIFFHETYDDDWAYGFDVNNATFNDTFWQDTGELYIGGDIANGDNPIYGKEVGDAVTTPNINSICRR